MALSSSGAISLNQIQSEFGGSNPIGISEYYNKDPYKPTPASGQISLNNFRGSSNRTAKITVGTTSESSPLYGYGSANGGLYYAQYSGKSGAAFGSITKTSNLISGRTLAAFCCFRETDVINSWLSTYRTVSIVQRGSGNNNWTSVSIKFATSGTVYTLTRSSGSYVSPASGVSPTGSLWHWTGGSGSAAFNIYSGLGNPGGIAYIRFD